MPNSRFALRPAWRWLLLCLLALPALRGQAQSCPATLTPPASCSSCTGTLAYCQRLLPGSQGPDDALAINACLNEPTCKCAQLERGTYQVRSQVFADAAPNRGRNLDGGRLLGRGVSTVLKVVGNGGQCSFPSSTETVPLPGGGTTTRRTYRPVIDITRASDFILDGFKIDLADRFHRCADSSFVFGSHAILVRQASARPRLTNLEIAGTPFVNASTPSGGVNTGGILVVAGPGAVIQGNRITDIGYQLDDTTGSSGVSAIQVNNSARSCIASNTVNRVSFGIEVVNFLPVAGDNTSGGDSSGTVLRQNTIVGAAGIRNCDRCSQGRAIKLQACRAAAGTVNGVSCPPVGNLGDPPPMRDLVVESNTATSFGGRNPTGSLQANGSGLDLICGVQFSRFAGNNIDGQGAAAEFGLQLRSSFEPCNPFNPLTTTHHNTFVNNRFFSGAGSGTCGTNCRDVNINADAPDQISLGRNRDTPTAGNSYRPPIRRDGGANLCPGSDSSEVRLTQTSAVPTTKLQFPTRGVRPATDVLVRFRRADGFEKTFTFRNVACTGSGAKKARKIGLEPGTYTVTADYQDGNAGTGSDRTQPVAILGDRLGTLTVAPAPLPPPVTGQLTVAPSSVTLAAPLGGAASQTLVLGSTGSAQEWQASEGAPWLSLSPASGTTPGSLRVDASAAGLAAGTYQTTILVSALDSEDILVPVTFTVSKTQVSSLTVSPASLAFTGTAGGANPASKSLSVGSTGAALSFSVADNASWLTVTPASASTPATLAAAVNLSGLAAGTYFATVTVSSAGAPVVSVPVTLTLTPSCLLPMITSVFPAGGAVGTAVTISGQSLTGATAVRFNGTAAPFSPLTNNFLSASVPNGATSGLVTVTTPCGTSNGLFFSVAGVQLTVNPGILSFTAPQGGPAPPPQVVQIGSTAGSLSFTATDNQSFINLSPAAGVTPGATNVSINVGGLPAGTYTGTLTVSAPGAMSAFVPVNLTVTASGPGLPLVNGFSPFSGGTSTPVEVIGANFVGVSQLDFNGTPAPFSLNSSGRIFTSVPPGATTGPIGVTNAAGRGVSFTPFTVTQGSCPSITSLSPPSGAPGDRITIFGANFQPGAQVSFNSVGSPFVLFAGSAFLSAEVPFGATTGPVRVTVNACTATSGTNFVVTAVP